MKKIFIVIAVLTATLCKAQDISVESFQLIDNDLTANTSGTIVLDQNGEKCALIKVATSQTDFTFDAGMMGVVKTVQHPGEIWLYVPAGVKRLTISHVGMETLRDHDLGMSVQKARTYLLTLKTSKDVVLQTVNFSVTPTNTSIALECIDAGSDFGRKSITLSNGTASIRIPVGNYKYMALAAGYIIEDGIFSITAQSPRNVLLQLVPESTQPSATPVPIVPESQSTPNPSIASNTSPASQTFTVNGVSFKMIYVEGGTFTMGATSEQASDAYDNERPSHSVTLSSYYIGETEVTQELWKAIMGKNLSHFKNDSQNPVESVSWEDCQEFISKLKSITCKNFRLLTEAEWEFAARGGSKSKGYKYSGSNDIGSVAWYTENSSRKTRPVKTKMPNELGIYDMSGNVLEWCSDCDGPYQPDSVTNPIGSSSSSNRIIRGGGYYCVASDCRVSYRYYRNPSIRTNDGLGLRLGL